MNKITYNERVQALAEKMLKGSCMVQNSHNLYSVFIPAARIAVSETAQAARSVFSYIDAPGIDPISDVNNYLEEQGLIPDKGQEAGKDGKE